MNIVNEQETNPFGQLDGPQRNNVQLARGMRVIIWVMWIFLVTFLFIVLCNFLIAYIS